MGVTGARFFTSGDNIHDTSSWWELDLLHQETDSCLTWWLAHGWMGMQSSHGNSTHIQLIPGRDS